MKRFVYFALLIAGLLLAIQACQPKTHMPEEGKKLCLPRDLEIDTLSDHYARIAWHPGCSGVRIMRGFNIYLSPVPLVETYSGRELPASVIPFNALTYPGDTVGNANRETYECKDIENARIYFVHVRAVYNDESLSPPTNEIELVTWPQGEIELHVSYAGTRDGFSLTKEDYCGTDDPENDIYFYHKDGIDYLCSPSRISPVNRDTKIYRGNSDSPWDVGDDIQFRGDPAEKVTISAGGEFVLKTANGYPARLRVADISGSGEDRVITFKYIYKPPPKREPILSGC